MDHHRRRTRPNEPTGRVFPRELRAGTLQQLKLIRVLTHTSIGIIMSPYFHWASDLSTSTTTEVRTLMADDIKCESSTLRMRNRVQSESFGATGCRTRGSTPNPARVFLHPRFLALLPLTRRRTMAEVPNFARNGGDGEFRVLLTLSVSAESRIWDYLKASFRMFVLTRPMIKAPRMLRPISKHHFRPLRQDVQEVDPS